MKLGRSKRVELDPNVQFPRRRETDHQANLRNERIELRRKGQAEDHAWITRSEIRRVKFSREYKERPHGKKFSIIVGKEEFLTPYGARQKKLRRAAAKVARQARAANFRRLAVARRQRQKRRRQGR